MRTAKTAIILMIVVSLVDTGINDGRVLNTAWSQAAEWSHWASAKFSRVVKTARF